MEPYRISCTINWAGEAMEDKLFIYFCMIFAYGIPLTTCIVCYTAIYIKIRRAHYKTKIRGTTRNKLEINLIKVLLKAISLK